MEGPWVTLALCITEENVNIRLTWHVHTLPGNHQEKCVCSGDGMGSHRAPQPRFVCEHSSHSVRSRQLAGKDREKLALVFCCPNIQHLPTSLGIEDDEGGHEVVGHG